MLLFSSRIESRVVVVAGTCSWLLFESLGCRSHIYLQGKVCMTVLCSFILFRRSTKIKLIQELPLYPFLPRKLAPVLWTLILWCSYLCCSWCGAVKGEAVPPWAGRINRFSDISMSPVLRQFMSIIVNAYMEVSGEWVKSFGVVSTCVLVCVIGYSSVLLRVTDAL